MKLLGIQNPHSQWIASENQQNFFHHPNFIIENLQRAYQIDPRVFYG